MIKTLLSIVENSAIDSSSPVLGHSQSNRFDTSFGRGPFKAKIGVGQVIKGKSFRGYRYVYSDRSQGGKKVFPR